MTSAEVIKYVAGEIKATKKEVMQALLYNCVIEEIEGQVNFLRENPQEEIYSLGISEE